MKVLYMVVFVMLVAALGFGVYLMWMNFPFGSVSYNPFSANLSSRIAPQLSFGATEGAQFYPNMRFRDRSISYRLESICTQKKWDDVNRAFELLEEKTILHFYSLKEGAEISIFCSELPPEPAERKGHFIAGEGGPTEIMNMSTFSVIFGGKISIYRDEPCDEPKIALHEILHALGFDHHNDTKSTMYPITGCNQQLDQYIIDDINRLYRIDSAPDILIEEISANKTGRFLNFYISVSNYGLKEAENVTLYVYSDGLLVGNFPLERLDIGMKKKLAVQNVRMPMDSEKVAFEVYPGKGEKEISMENNRIEIAIAKDNI